MDLIDRNELMELLADLIFDRDNDAYFKAICDVQEIVSKMPSENKGE